jgi:hypothetical protein
VLEQGHRLNWRAEGRAGFFCDVRTLQLFANQFAVGFEDEAPASLEPDRKCREHFQYSLKPDSLFRHGRDIGERKRRRPSDGYARA